VLNIIYFLSSRHPYEIEIYPGVGPRCAQIFGWSTGLVETINDAHCDVSIIDNRLENSDLGYIEKFLARSHPRFPIFFKLSDPDMPIYGQSTDRYVLQRADVPGVHYISIYDPDGPLRDFMATLKRSKVVRLPFPYDASQEVEGGFEKRRRKVFLSGAADRRLYPLRSTPRRQMRLNPLLRLIVTDLPHPGYPTSGRSPRHAITFERFVRYAPQYSHFFLCSPPVIAAS
jgi:hypothetical protein